MSTNSASKRGDSAAGALASACSIRVAAAAGVTLGQLDFGLRRLQLERLAAAMLARPFERDACRARPAFGDQNPRQQRARLCRIDAALLVQLHRARRQRLGLG